jgi:hypothetical protein
MKRSIEEILDEGLTITNSKGGYMRKVGEGHYLFQTYYRSSNYGSLSEMVELFLEEHK